MATPAGSLCVATTTWLPGSVARTCRSSVCSTSSGSSSDQAYAASPAAVSRWTER